MPDATIYFNPGCSTCRATLDLMNERGVRPRVVEYLKDAPTAAQIRELLGLLGIGPRDLLRTKEPACGERGLDDPAVDDETIIEAMAAEPILIQRPIVVVDGRAILGRPPERVLDLLG